MAAAFSLTACASGALHYATPSPAEPAPSASTASTASTASPAPAASDATVLEIATTADQPIAFTKDTLVAPAGATVTVRYTNDSSVPHNIAFFEGGDATAPRIAATEVESGPGNVQTVTFTAPDQPGDYFFHCDVHPQQMTGTFQVTG